MIFFSLGLFNASRSVMHYGGGKVASWWADEPEQTARREQARDCSHEIKLRLRKRRTWDPERRKQFYRMNRDQDAREATDGDIKKIRCFYKCEDPVNCVHKP